MSRENIVVAKGLMKRVDSPIVAVDHIDAPADSCSLSVTYLGSLSSFP
jgi:hypothetical protein